MRIGVTGASGMLGTALINELSAQNKVFATSRHQGLQRENVQWSCFDITCQSDLKKWLIEVNPDVVVHCAAIVNVDECENDVGLANKLHVGVTENLASYLKTNNKMLVYISTDSVFDGTKDGPYVESDKVNPLNTYAKTKLQGEYSVLSMQNGVVLRTNIVGCSRLGNTSFAEWVFSGLSEKKALTLFEDVVFSPLHVKDLSVLITEVIKARLSGLYHCASRDYVSKYDFGRGMAEIFDLSIDNVKKVSIDHAGLKAIRPKNMALDSGKICLDLGVTLPEAKNAIRLLKRQRDAGECLK